MRTPTKDQTRTPGCSAVNNRPPGNQARRSAGALAALLLATFMGFLDLFIVNVAAPSIEQELPASFAQIQLVLSGYIVAYAVGLVIGGRLGDRYGRRRMWLLGVAGFVLTSVLCGAAPTAAALVVARLLQGLTAALMLPQVLASIQVLFDGPARARAIGAYGAVIGLASLSGQLVGGALIALNLASSGWRSVFFVNVPLGGVAMLIGARSVPQTRASQRRPIDVLGAALLGAAVVLLLYPVIAASAHGWSTPLTATAAAGAAAAGCFVQLERRRERNPSREPLIRPSLTLIPQFRWGLTVILAFYAGNSGFFLVLAYYLQSGLHESALQSGLGFLPLGAGFTLGSLASQRLTRRWDTKVLFAGTALILAGLAGCLAALHGSAAFTDLLPALLACGLGQGLIAPPLIGLVLQDIDPDTAGAASGALLTTTQVANILSVAITGALFAAFLTGTARSDYNHAFTGALTWLLALALLLGLLITRLARLRRQSRSQVSR